MFGRYHKGGPQGERPPAVRSTLAEDCKGLNCGQVQPIRITRSATVRGWFKAIHQDRCIQMLGECGFLPAGPVGLVNLCGIPDGLNAEELERYLREDVMEDLIGEKWARPKLENAE